MKTYDVFLCHSNRHDADTATENIMAMVYVLLKDQLGSRPRGQARRGGDPRRLRPGPPARARDRHAPERRGRTAAARAGRQVAPAEGISWASPITPAWSRSVDRTRATQSASSIGLASGDAVLATARVCKQANHIVRFTVGDQRDEWSSILFGERLRMACVECPCSAGET